MENMNRFEIQNAVDKIHGYYFPRINTPDSKEKAFERAKAEAIANIEKSIEDIKKTTFKQFKKNLGIKDSDSV